jgi:hypothetical protein
MLARAHVEKVIRVCTEEADFEAFRAYAAPDFVYEFIGTQPFAGEWRGVDGAKRQFAAIQEHFTSKFGFAATRTAAVLCTPIRSPTRAAVPGTSTAHGSCTSTKTRRSPGSCNKMTPSW